MIVEIGKRCARGYTMTHSRSTYFKNRRVLSSLKWRSDDRREFKIRPRKNDRKKNAKVHARVRKGNRSNWLQDIIFIFDMCFTHQRSKEFWITHDERYRFNFLDLCCPDSDVKFHTDQIKKTNQYFSPFRPHEWIFFRHSVNVGTRKSMYWSRRNFLLSWTINLFLVSRSIDVSIYDTSFCVSEKYLSVTVITRKLHSFL